MAFWVALTILACAGAAALAWPLVAPARTGEPSLDDRERRLAVYRDRRREIELDADAGRLSPEEAERAIGELVDEVAELFVGAEGGEPTGPAAAPPAPVTGRHWAVAALVAIVVPGIAVPVYRMVGTPEARVVEQREAPASPQEQEAHLRAMITELEQRTVAKPDDGEAWVMLAQARRMLGEPALALPAYERALALIGSNARLLADYAETAAVAAGGDFTGKPTELLRRALVADPADPKANGLMGAVLYREGRFEEAERHLRVLLGALPAGTEQARSVEAVLERIAARRGTPAGGSAATRPADGSAPAPSAGSITGRVEIAGELAARVPPGAVLFVYARAAEGPRMPYAVLRVPAQSLPLGFQLGDAQSLSPDRKLSTAGTVVVEARVSVSGSATPATGDLVGTSAPVRPGAQDVVVRIERTVP